MNKISVLVVDDSALMRNLIGRIIESDSSLILAGRAVDGLDALEKVTTLMPHVITLDLEMPNMDGIAFLKELKLRSITIPVIILSSIATKGAEVTMKALSLGASDFITKPSGSISLDIKVIADQLNDLIKAYGSSYLRTQKFNFAPLPTKKEIDRPLLDQKRRDDPLAMGSDKSTFTNLETINCELPKKMGFEDWPVYLPGKKTQKVDLLCIGISTGGPNALRILLSKIDKDLPVPVLIVQHMPAGFTLEFAKSLNRVCPLEVKEAENGDELSAGHVYIAPGDYHIAVERLSLHKNIIRLNQEPLRNGHRPSADVLFESVAKNYGERSLAVIMTGMGRDGARQIGELYHKGALTLAQDKESCIVFGMPKIAIEAGYIDKIVPLEQMASTINRLVKEHR